MLCAGGFIHVDHVDDLLAVDDKLTGVALGDGELGVIILQRTVIIVNVRPCLILHREGIGERARLSAGGEHRKDLIGDGILQIIVHSVLTGIAANREVGKLGVFLARGVMHHEGTALLRFNAVFRPVGSEGAGGECRHQCGRAEVIRNAGTGLIGVKRQEGVNPADLLVCQMIDLLRFACGDNAVFLTSKGEGGLVCIFIQRLLKLLAECLGGIYKAITLGIDVKGFRGTFFEGIGDTVQLKGSAFALAGFCCGLLQAGDLFGIFISIGQLLAHHAVRSDVHFASSRGADQLRLGASEGVYLAAQHGDQIGILPLEDEAGGLPLLDHALDVAVHGVNNGARKFHALIQRIAVVGGVAFGQGVVDILRAVFVENLLLPVGIEQRPDKGEDKHGDQQAGSEDRKTVAHKALEHLSPG